MIVVGGNMSNETVTTSSERETLNMARRFASGLHRGDIIALVGELGAGKTVFARGIVESLGSPDVVTSPTFTLINEYRGTIPLYHMDLYRIESMDDLINIGVEDYLYGDGICIVEWAERLGELTPDRVIRVSILHGGGNMRTVSINGDGDRS